MPVVLYCKQQINERPTFGVGLALDVVEELSCIGEEAAARRTGDNLLLRMTLEMVFQFVFTFGHHAAAYKSSLCIHIDICIQ